MLVGLAANVRARTTWNTFLALNITCTTIRCCARLWDANEFFYDLVGDTKWLEHIAQRTLGDSFSGRMALPER